MFAAKSPNSKERKNTSAGCIKARRGWEVAIILNSLLIYEVKDFEWIVILGAKVLYPESADEAVAHEFQNNSYPLTCLIRALNLINERGF